MKIIKYATLLVLLSSFIILSYNCSIDAPKAPRYDVSLQLVLIDTTYTIEELSDESDNLSLNDDNMLEFNLNGTIDTVKVQDQLNIDSQNYYSKMEMGEFEIKLNKAYRDSSLEFVQLLPGIENFQGSLTAIEPFELPTVSSNSIILGKLEYAKIKSGTAVITIENHLPVPLGPPLTVRIYDKVNGFINEVEFSEIIPADTGKALKTIDLSNTTINNPIYFEIWGQSGGSGVEQVLVDTTAYVVLEIFVESITVSEADAQMGSYDISDSIEVDLTNEMSITEAKFISGMLTIQLKNYLPLGAGGAIVFEDIYKDDGTNLKLNVSLSSNQDTNNELHEEINLSGYIIKPEAVDVGQMQKMKVRIAAKTDSTGSRTVELKTNDYLTMDISLENIMFEYVTGIFDRTELELKPGTTNVNLPDGFENIQLSKAKLKLDIFNRINFPIEVALQLKGNSNSGNEVTLSIYDTLTARGNNKEAHSEILLDETNSEIVGFMNNLPNSVEVAGKAYIGDGINPITIYRDDYIRAQYDITTPMQMIIEEKVINIDTTEIFIVPENYNGDEEIEGNTIDASVADQLISGLIIVTVTNHLSLGMKINLLISDELSTLYSNPKVEIGPIEIPAGELNSIGDVITEKTKENEVELTSEDFDIFKNDTAELKTVYIGTKIHLLGSDGKTVSIYKNDYLKLTASTLLKINIDFDD